MKKSKNKGYEKDKVIINGCSFTLSDYVAGVRHTENRNVSPFNRIKALGGMDVEWKQSQEFKIEINGEADILKQVITDVEDGILTLDIAGQHVTSPIQVTINCPSLLCIMHEGVGDFYAENLTCAERFEINKIGVGNFRIRGSFKHLLVDHGAAGNMQIQSLSSQRTEIRHRGPGNFIIVGETDTLKIQHTGAGHLNTKYLSQKDLSVSHSGPGRVKIRSSKNASIHNSGWGTIDVYGADESISNSNTGSGAIHIH